MSGWNFDTTYQRLPEILYSRVDPTPVSKPQLLILNNKLADDLGIGAQYLSSPQGINELVGNETPRGSTPLAQAYAGHQFGHFTMLGDGRALLLGEHVSPSGLRYDIQLKGSGQTPYSRRGDGRAAIGPMLREYLISEAIAALGIPTTRSLAVVATGDSIYREQVLPGAVLARVATSHIRVGTFEFAAAKGGPALTKALADYSIDRHYPEISTSTNKYVEFLRAVIQRQVDLVTKWILVGFIHGVLNTDNVAISGESIDFGPCAFMDTYDPSTVFSSIDHSGRYSYENQLPITQWNMARFAEAVLPLLSSTAENAMEVGTHEIERIPQLFKEALRSGMARKLGFSSVIDGDDELSQDVLSIMFENKLDYTSTFRSLANYLSLTSTPPALLDAWIREKWRPRLHQEGRSELVIREQMLAINPSRIPRNYRVEESLAAIVDRGDFSLFNTLLSLCQNPFDDDDILVSPPPVSWSGYQTFCGT